ncbi:chemotaxis protein CheX [Anaerobacillus sp. MEB173]|uniref:chemotaxis protein CheX n=1 Tax=Anaerobacillus sp. MEB173 TaxID=3383345 RepID=UPI003F9162C3
MDNNHLNAITRATKSILNSHLGVEASPLQPILANKAIPSNDISVILGINGEFEGQIIYSMGKSTAMSIVSAMMGGMSVETIDDMGWSAIQEFGNWMAGTTATELSAENCTINVTPPVVNEGASVFRTNDSFMTMPVQSSIGEIDVHITVEKVMNMK